MPAPNRQRLISLDLSTVNLSEASDQVMAWAQAGESRTVCAANVHMVMEAYDDPTFQDVVNGADLVTADGMPLVWGLRRLGHPHQSRVCGPDLTLEVCGSAAAAGIPVGFYGGREQVLDALCERLRAKFPALRIAYTHSPPFRELTPQEAAAILHGLQMSEARILFVGLGCPRQECWIAAHRQDIQAVMIGVGAAFDFHAGTLRHAPGWMQRSGLEWAFRLVMEPQRLWKRYAKHNPRYLALLALQLAFGWTPRRGISSIH
jgi:N-acetylglucosaminyldiphosphoundecaprenol N-acetyl-beta-D-mannosaminyltransferase